MCIQVVKILYIHHHRVCSKVPPKWGYWPPVSARLGTKQEDGMKIVHKGKKNKIGDQTSFLTQFVPLVDLPLLVTCDLLALPSINPAFLIMSNSSQLIDTQFHEMAPNFTHFTPSINQAFLIISNSSQLIDTQFHEMAPNFTHFYSYNSIWRIK